MWLMQGLSVTTGEQPAPPPAVAVLDAPTPPVPPGPPALPPLAVVVLAVVPPALLDDVPVSPPAPVPPWPVPAEPPVWTLTLPPHAESQIVHPASPDHSNRLPSIGIPPAPNVSC